MIRVELGEEVRGQGIWRWEAAARSVSGVSRQPLLDACRALERIGVARDQRVGLFREGRLVPDLFCTVGAGAGLTVDENGPWFRKWKPHPRSR